MPISAAAHLGIPRHRRTSAARRRPVQARPRHDLISMLQDRILICDPIDNGECFDAPGQPRHRQALFRRADARRAARPAVERACAPSSPARIQRTRVEDPITGKPRKLSGFFPDWQWDLDVRRDAGTFSYGFERQRQPALHLLPHRRVRHQLQRRRLRDRVRRISAAARTAITLDVDNALDTAGNRDRLLFFPNRAEPEARSSTSSASATATSASASR